MIVDIVTGATQGIGRAVAEYIAIQRSSSSPNPAAHALVLVGRNENRGTQVRDFLREEHTSKNGPLRQIHFAACDLSDWRDVQGLPGRVASLLGGEDTDPFQVGILVNNAAECPRRQEWVERRQRQPDGSIQMEKIDKQFASNVLGYHFMMRAFRDHFASSPDDDHAGSTCTAATGTTSPTHIVNVASTWAGGLDLSDVSFQRRGYDNDDAYRQSKQCNRMLSRTWSQRLTKDVALVNACHPGDPCTTLSKDLGYNLYAGAPTWKQIAQDSPFPLLCGFQSSGGGGESLATTGGWFVGSGNRPSRCGFERQSKEAEQLFDLCESFCV